MSSKKLYIKTNDIYSDIVRMILNIKGSNADFVDVSKEENSKHLEELNIITPNCNIPTLFAHNLKVYGIGVIIEAIEDIYPYPPMFPVFAKQRANVRILLEYINKTFLYNIHKLCEFDLSKHNVNEIKKVMQGSLIRVYKIILREKNVIAKSNPDGENINILILIMTVVFHYFIKLKIAIPTKDKSIIKEIKNLINEPSFIKSIKQEAD